MTGGGFDPEAYRGALQQGAAIAAHVLMDDPDAAAAAADGDHLAIASAGSIIAVLRRTNELHYPEDWPKVRDLLVDDLRGMALAGLRDREPAPDDPTTRHE